MLPYDDLFISFNLKTYRAKFKVVVSNESGTQSSYDPVQTFTSVCITEKSHSLTLVNIRNKS